MDSVIVVHPRFDGVWPFAADHAHARWQAQGAVIFRRLDPADTRPAHEVIESPERVGRLIALGVPFTSACLHAMPALRELVCTDPVGQSLPAEMAGRGVRRITQTSEGYWGQSVSEFGLALTLCGLRRIPQTHHEIIASRTPWQYDPPDGLGLPGTRGQAVRRRPAVHQRDRGRKARPHRGCGQHRQPLCRLRPHARRGCRGVGPLCERTLLSSGRRAAGMASR